MGDGFIWKVQDGITLVSGTLVALAGQLGSAGTVGMGSPA